MKYSCRLPPLFVHFLDTYLRGNQYPPIFPHAPRLFVFLAGSIPLAFRGRGKGRPRFKTRIERLLFPRPNSACDSESTISLSEKGRVTRCFRDPFCQKRGSVRQSVTTAVLDIDIDKYLIYE